MDIDRFVSRHQAAWQRLEQLCAPHGRRHPLSPPELDELLLLYQRVSGHLSFARTELADHTLVTRLTNLVATANGVVYGVRARRRGGVRRFVTETFPAAVWRNRWFVAVSGALTIVPAVVIGVWIANSRAALEASAPAAVREAYVNREFASYYSSAPAAEFATKVFTNNIRVAMLAFAAGVLLCVLTAWILVQNGANVGFAAGLFAAAGQQPKFWGLILPHGLLELSAVVVAGGAGLRLGWTIVDPGDRLRAAALAEEGKRAAMIVLGLVPVFALAGTIEGFITGRGLPTAPRVGIGVAVFAVFWAYLAVLGRSAMARGVTGLPRERRVSASADAPQRPPGTARVVTWNLWWRFGDEPERRTPAIAATLTALDADVVCVQEVYGDDTGADDGAALAAALGMRCVAAPPVFHQGRSFGNAVLTRWPVLAEGAERLPGPDGAPGHRRAVWAVLDAPCGPTAVVSTHLAYRFDESAVRLLQIGGLCRLAARLRSELAGGSGAEPRDLPPVVLCGDLNAVPDSDEIRALTGRAAPPVANLVFTDCWPQVRDDPGHTWDRRNPYLRDATWPQRRLDYVLTSWPRRAPVGNPVQAFLVGDAPVDGIWPSDHLGVAVDLRTS